jgi:hypothetical protein
VFPLLRVLLLSGCVAKSTTALGATDSAMSFAVCGFGAVLVLARVL